MRFWLLVICFCTGINVYAQLTNSHTYDIKRMGKGNYKNCSELILALDRLPPDVRVSPIVKNDSVYLALPDPIWLKTAIVNKKDGIAIDLVHKKQFDCDVSKVVESSDIHTGFLLPPVYRNDMPNRMQQHSSGTYLINLGAVPLQFATQPYEANYIIIKNNIRCYYTNIVGLDFHGWKLLKTGLYYDTLDRNKLENRFKDLTKSLVFTVPFEKDKVEYKPADIKPLYDSLNITDYTVKSISIRAFTSVEGNYEHNLELQNKRAESIVAALQSYQSEKIISSVSTDENWVEFLTDIGSTNYNSFLSLSKKEIKEKLKSPELLRKLEPILRKHRKAIIELELEKKLSFRESNTRELKKYFQSSIASKNIEEALYLQNIIFYKIEKQELPESFLNELEVPEALEFGGLLINKVAFLQENEFYTVADGLAAFEKLDRLIPNNKKIKFNLCALKLKSWLYTDLLNENEAIRKEIEALRKYGVSDALVRRLLINYNIILSEVKLNKRDYSGKDKAMQFIYNAYRPLKLNDADLVNLAKYFSHYSKFEWALQVVAPRINSLSASEDLLFYYINLTIYQPKYTSNKFYRATLLNAVNRNKKRFCQLFNSNQEDGISFQLLTDGYLKKNYCENCNQQ
jgi:hypothetical protein